jgi:hypothetical protein
MSLSTEGSINLQDALIQLKEALEIACDWVPTEHKTSDTSGRIAKVYDALALAERLIHPPVHTTSEDISAVALSEALAEFIEAREAQFAAMPATGLRK